MYISLKPTMETAHMKANTSMLDITYISIT